MEYIGIDVHQRESQVCILDAAGRIVLERRVGNASTAHTRTRYWSSSSRPPWPSDHGRLGGVNLEGAG
jgi:hypothetical protein